MAGRKGPHVIRIFSKIPRIDGFALRMALLYAAFFAFSGIQMPYLPVWLEAKFDDGSTVRERWDGKDRWHRFTWRRKAKLVSAEVDPDHGYCLDRDPFNNSWTVKADSKASGKLAAYWTLLTQWLEQALSWLA